ncbi:MAG: nuclear transport factor 2 family protein [Bacteroidales bacterium]|nr:nuclear transport factor 2 family protein [Bacteroidales bacterium]
MKVLFYQIIAILVCLSSCQTTDKNFDNDAQEQISDSLKTVAIHFLRSWEPPFNPDKAINLFTQSKDFHLVIDGFTTKTFEEWKDGVPNYMADDDSFFKSYKHEIKDIRTVVLSPESGVVTITYIWDNISSKDDTHKRVDGAITLTCRQEKDGWKIVHYHGSHGDERIVE